MGKKTIGVNLVGTQNTTYDLDEIQSDSRTNSEKPLFLHIWKYNPGLDLNTTNNPERRFPNPPNLKVGQIWMSVLDESIK